MLSRRQLLRATAGAAGLAATRSWWPSAASAAAALPAALPSPASAPFDHVVVVMMENRSFDHFLGWLPGADGKQAGLTYTDQTGTTYPTYQLAPDYQGCGYDDPDHSWEAGVVQLNGGKLDGFLKPAPGKTRNPKDTFPIGYYTEDSLPVLGALAKSYTTLDRYFCSILAETFPNRFYQHAARTDRDHNNGITQTTLSPTIWDRIAAAGLTGRYYFVDEPFLALWGPKYLPIINDFARFVADATAGQLPNLSFVDPSFAEEGAGASGDDHPHGDIRSGESYLGLIYHAIRTSPQWDRTVMVVNFDEWGGFYDHVVPPLVPDDTVRAAMTAAGAAHPDYRQLGFRVPSIVISPFAPARIVHDGPYEHTSVLKMVEWRWGLQPLTMRDANARNLAEVLDFSTRRSDDPAVPMPPLMPSAPCGPQSTAAHPPDAISSPATGGGAGGSGGGGTGGNGAGSGAGGSDRGGLPATGGVGAAAAAGAAAVGAGLALRRRRDGRA